MEGILDEIGIAGALLAYYDDAGVLRTWDGHLRKTLAADTPWPVLITDLTEAEVNVMLAVGDELPAMAERDPDKTLELLSATSTDSPAVASVLDSLAALIEADREEGPGASELHPPSRYSLRT